MWIEWIREYQREGGRGREGILLVRERGGIIWRERKGGRERERERKKRKRERIQRTMDGDGWSMYDIVGSMDDEAAPLVSVQCDTSFLFELERAKLVLCKRMNKAHRLRMWFKKTVSLFIDWNSLFSFPLLWWSICSDLIDIPGRDVMYLYVCRYIQSFIIRLPLSLSLQVNWSRKSN